jgi:hypothetical protein
MQCHRQQRRLAGVEPDIIWTINNGAGHRLARFREINLEISVHHDALEFPDGRIVLLTTLRPGQHATVLQLPASQKPENLELRAEETRAA